MSGVWINFLIWLPESYAEGLILGDLNKSGPTTCPPPKKKNRKDNGKKKKKNFNMDGHIGKAN